MSKRLSIGAAFLLGTSTLAATAFMPTLAQAQVTSSSVSGVVVTNTGAPVSGANVTITHVPTGRVKRTVTSLNGTFFETGLMVGGPYTVNVTSTEGNILRENLRFSPSTNSLQLSIASIQDEIIVTATRTSQSIGDGVGSAYSSEEILGQPSATRDLIATLVRDPLANTTGEGILSVAGANPRFNALAIDGSLQQDDFGLSSSTYATARSPISLDVVESASVVATDYSVTQSGFTGGLVNIVTKSGTNEFDGSLYFYKQNEDFFGDETKNGRAVTVAPFDEEEYGFVLSGPIIKDKLFFLASYDEFSSGSGREFSQNDADNGVDASLYPILANLVQSGLGYDIGSRPLSVSNPVSSERILGKIDWNISDQHRASFTYQNSKEDGFGGVGSTTFDSAYYATPSDLKAYTGQLFSDWSDNFSTELRVNYKDYERAQNCNAGEGVGAIEIELSAADVAGTALDGLIAANVGEVEFDGGCDAFRQGNTFADERLQIQGIGRLTGGDHLLTFGAEFQNYQLSNLFAQESVGSFLFESVASLQSGVADQVTVRLPDTGNREDTLAEWGYDQLALFIQDSFQVTPNFRVDAGVRYEVIMQDDVPEARTFVQQLYGVPNTQNLDGNDLFMPRASFEWNVFDRTTLTGGLGIYGGGDPKVWTSNAFTPPVFFERQFNVAVPAGVSTPAALIAGVTSNSANDPGPVDIIDPSFETPSDFKASLRLNQEFDLNFGDFNLGEDYQFSAQVIYTDNKNGFGWQNLTQLQDPAALPIGTAPDGRPIYADLDDLRLNNVIALTNVDQGESIVYTASLAKDWNFGLGAYVSYAYQDIEQATPGGSSRGVSNFRGVLDFDRNFASPGRSVYETEHAFKVALTYDREILAGLQSRFSLFGNITSGEPYSYTFDVDRSNALFGRSGDFESPFDNDLLYVPTITGGAITDGNVVVANGFDEAAFVAFVDRQGLSSGIQDKNEGSSGWNQQWDFQWQQEIPFFNKQAEKFVGENKLKFVLDITNVANLINSDWGTQSNGPGFDAVGNVRADLVTAADVAANGVDGASALSGDDARTACSTGTDCVYRFNSFRDRDVNFESLFRSVYEVRVGLRYEF